MEAKIIAHGSPEYAAELELRNAVLREPLGLSIYDENLEAEAEFIHVAVFERGEIIATGYVFREGGHGRVRQIATAETSRRRGAGRLVMETLEEAARQAGMKQILLHARKTAWEFYEKLGYHAVGNEFSELEIPHRIYVKKLEQAAVPKGIAQFLDNFGKIESFPVKRPKQLEVLAYLAAKIEGECVYTEREINEKITEWHSYGDHATLRRDLCDAGFLVRTSSGSEYRRTEK